MEHDDWAAFQAATAASRIVALSSRGTAPLQDFEFGPDDILLLGRESAGLPPGIVAACGGAVRIPITAGNRSLNVASAASIALFEALRRTGTLPQAG